MNINFDGYESWDYRTLQSVLRQLRSEGITTAKLNQTKEALLFEVAIAKKRTLNLKTIKLSEIISALESQEFKPLEVVQGYYIDREFEPGEAVSFLFEHFLVDWDLGYHVPATGFQVLDWGKKQPLSPLAMLQAGRFDLLILFKPETVPMIQPKSPSDEVATVEPQKNLSAQEWFHFFSQNPSQPEFSSVLPREHLELVMEKGVNFLNLRQFKKLEEIHGETAKNIYPTTKEEVLEYATILKHYFYALPCGLDFEGVKSLVKYYYQDNLRFLYSKDFAKFLQSVEDLGEEFLPEIKEKMSKKDWLKYLKKNPTLPNAAEGILTIWLLRAILVNHVNPLDYSKANALVDHWGEEAVNQFPTTSNQSIELARRLREFFNSLPCGFCQNSILNLVEVLLEQSLTFSGKKVFKLFFDSIDKLA